MFQNSEMVQWPRNRTGGLREAHGTLDGLGDSHFVKLGGAMAGEGRETRWTAKLAVARFHYVPLLPDADHMT